MASHARYDSINNSSNAQSPYGSGDPYYNESSGYITPHPAPKKGRSNWIRFGLPLLIVAIVAAVLGGVLGSRKSSNKDAAASGSSSSAGSAAQGSAAASAQKAIGIFATATNSFYMVPVYPSTTNTAAFIKPTFVDTTDPSIAWPTETFSPASPAPTTVRPDRPRIIAPSYKWQALPTLIQNNAYFKYWNDTIFGNATVYKAAQPVQYYMDGGNGILDIARQIKERTKAFGYAYRMTNNTEWVDRCWEELQNAAGNGTNSFGPNDVTRWNPTHFLDTAELTAAFAVAYDWMYDAWTSDQLESIRWTMIQYGLLPAQTALVGPDPDYYGWWTKNTTGNWNCVCNSGITLGSLAILNDDTTGIAQELIPLAIANATDNCVFGPTSDGTWSETADYWYFGSTGHAEMSSTLISATGKDWGMLTTNPDMYLSGIYHMHAHGPTSLFNNGDTGPNKFSATANCLFFYATAYGHPEMALFQRDQFDAPSDPWSMFWYDPSVNGAFWDDMPLDHYFDNEVTQWAAMRSSWTDGDALYVAIKAGMNQGRQTHNDLDAGDFVLDALGTRWAGELGDGNYNAPYYFSNDSQDSVRWYYYRKMTEGQNTILVNASNQNVLARPTVTYGSSNDTQGSSTVYNVQSNSTAYFVANLTSAYFNTESFWRGMRTLNSRKQVLLQDEITATGSIQWRMHTNATVTLNSDTKATLTIGEETMIVELLNAPSGVKFGTAEPVRLPTDPIPPEPDQPNPGVTVLTIDGMESSTYTLQVLFSPQWPGMSSSDYVTPPSVALNSWTLTSHNS